MNILAMDDDKIALEGLVDSIKKAAPHANVHALRFAEDALALMDSIPFDVAFLDVETSGVNGVDLAERLIERNPRINIVFATGHDNYRAEAFAMHASGYVMKPITPEKVKRELDDLRRPLESSRRVRIQAFGNFEVYLDGAPMSFRYNKAKELLAYLVDRKGALCTLGEICSVLFEDDADHASYLKRLRADLVASFEEAGCGDVIVRQRGKMGIAPNMVECDYYDWCEGKASRAAAFRGEYMAQYSWSEYTQASLQMAMTRI